MSKHGSDVFFLRFRGAVAKLLSPLFSFNMKLGAWYRKQDLIELMLHMAVMNSFAEGTANSLRRKGKAPTGETLLDYVKGLTSGEVLANAEAEIDHSVKELKLKGLSFKDVALAFDWHDEPYYGKSVPGMVGTKPKDGTCYAFSYLTASILTAGRRLVLCIVPLQSREGLPKLVLTLLTRIEGWVEGLGYVAFDNGFQSSELILQLQRSMGSPSSYRYGIL